MEILIALLTAIISSVPALAQEPIENKVTIEPVITKTAEKVELWDTFYFTNYALVESQTDKSPCYWASWKNLCEANATGNPTMALTVDVRRKYWIKRGDKIRLEWDPWCAGEYTVEDEMWCRFRWEYAGEDCINKKTGKRYLGKIYRKGYLIKWDVVNRAWWVCKIVF